MQDNTLLWIKNFLADRTQRVIVDGAISEEAPVTSGVPQGSVLGPVLFLTFINDLTECVKSSCRLFADDSIIYREINSTEDSNKLQEDLDSLTNWEILWGMKYNPEKCHILRVTRKRKPITTEYTLKGHILETVTKSTYLGVDITSDLTWNDHVNKITSKAKKTLGFVRRNIQTASLNTKVMAYQTLVRPQLEYCAVVWNPTENATLIKDIESVQRRAARYVFNDFYSHNSVSDMITKLKWDLLRERRKFMRLVMLYKIVNDLVDVPKDQLLLSTAGTQSNHAYKFIVVGATKNYHKQTFFSEIIPAWNELSKDAAEATTHASFKAAMLKSNAV